MEINDYFCILRSIFELSKSITLSSIDWLSSPANLYISSGLSWSINLSGKIMDLNFNSLSKRFFSDKKFTICEPNPPIDPSSIVIIPSWSVANCQIKFSSSGLTNLASAIVILIPFFFKLIDAFKHSFNLAPKLIIAIFFPSWIILPFPISNF